MLNCIRREKLIIGAVKGGRDECWLKGISGCFLAEEGHLSWTLKDRYDLAGGGK